VSASERRRTAASAAMRRAGRRAPLWVLALSTAGAALAALFVAAIAAERWYALVVLLAGLAVSFALYAIVRAGLQARASDARELGEAQAAVASHSERLRILHEIDRAIAAEEAPEAIAAAVLPPLRTLLAVARVVVNMFDLQSGEVEWLAAAGRRRTHVGPGGTGRAVHISGFEEWTFGDDGLIRESKGHFDEAEYQRQLEGDHSSSVRQG